MDSPQNLSPQIEDVLKFWFGSADSDAPEGSTSDGLYQRRRKFWFGQNPEFDRAIRDRFESLYQQAAAGHLDGWQQSPSGSLALILVLDQFPRNMFRHTPQAFATDFKAQQVAKGMIDRGDDRLLLPVQRIFVYLPLEHSENRDDQHLSVQQVEALVATQPALADCLDYAQRHQVVIERFGRFPHRNRILGRETTAEEAEFLQQPGSAF